MRHIHIKWILEPFCRQFILRNAKPRLFYISVSSYLMGPPPYLSPFSYAAPAREGGRRAGADLERLRFYGANEITFPFKIWWALPIMKPTQSRDISADTVCISALLTTPRTQHTKFELDVAHGGGVRSLRGTPIVNPSYSRPKCAVSRDTAHGFQGWKSLWKNTRWIKQLGCTYTYRKRRPGMRRDVCRSGFGF